MQSRATAASRPTGWQSEFDGPARDWIEGKQSKYHSPVQGSCKEADTD